jgi:hypothetical protein
MPYCVPETAGDYSVTLIVTVLHGFDGATNDRT